MARRTKTYIFNFSGDQDATSAVLNAPTTDTIIDMTKAVALGVELNTLNADVTNASGSVALNAIFSIDNSNFETSGTEFIAAQADNVRSAVTRIAETSWGGKPYMKMRVIEGNSGAFGAIATVLVIEEV